MPPKSPSHFSSPTAFQLVRRQDSSCLPCTEAPAPCTCPPEQCFQTIRTCTQCGENVCQATSSTGSSKGSLGSTIGGALGGVLGVLAAVALIYWFWWKPRGLAASRRRYSRHLSQRQSKMMGVGGGAGAAGAGTALEKRNTRQLSGDGTPGSPTAVAKRTSVHLRMDGGEPSTLNKRQTSPGPRAFTLGEDEDESIGASNAATGGHTRNSDEETDPFTDEARSSMFSSAGSTSDFSFRSSHSTNIIPIAYIPPHSSSMSLSDANRDAFGDLQQRQSHNHPPNRRSIPTSLASRDSLALAGAEIIEISPMPPILTPDTPLVPLSASANGAPIRPPRSPGLDLQLPKGKVTSPLASPDNVINGNRPPSGFPWGVPPSPPANRPNLVSTFSTATTVNRASSPYLIPPTPTSSAARHSTESHLSTISTNSSRSNGSTMSYILDPPQIITPVNAQGVRRVEVLGRGQAAERVRIVGSAAPNTPTSPAIDSDLPSPTTVTPGSPQSDNPFGDDAGIRFSVGGVTNVPQTGTSQGHMRTDSQSTVTASDPGYRSNESRWTASSANTDATGGRGGVNSTFYDVPHSARSSGYDTGDRSRVLMAPGMEISSSAEGGDEASLLGGRSSRASFASSGTRGSGASMLDGIPFLGPSSNTDAPSSPLFPMPPPRLSTAGNSTSTLPISDHHGSSLSLNTGALSDGTVASATAFYGQDRSDESEAEAEATGLVRDTDSPLPAPFLPFAGQRPTSSAPSLLSESPHSSGDRVTSQAISVRSGFGSGLSQIPFQLGFPSGLDGSERGSIMSNTTGFGGRDSYMGGPGGRDDDAGMLSGVEEVDEPPSARDSTFTTSDAHSPTSPTSSGTARPVSQDVSNPFGNHAQVLEGASAGDRASVDTLALSAELSRSLGVDD